MLLISSAMLAKMTGTVGYVSFGCSDCFWLLSWVKWNKSEIVMGKIIWIWIWISVANNPGVQFGSSLAWLQIVPIMKMKLLSDSVQPFIWLSLSWKAFNTSGMITFYMDIHELIMPFAKKLFSHHMECWNGQKLYLLYSKTFYFHPSVWSDMQAILTSEWNTTLS